MIRYGQHLRGTRAYWLARRHEVVGRSSFPSELARRTPAMTAAPDEPSPRPKGI